MKQASATKLIVGTIVVLAIVLAVGTRRETTVVFAQPSYTSSNLSTPTKNQCSSCHSGSAAAGGSAIVSFPSGTTYTPGVKQHLTVKITDPTHTRGGYQLTARLASSLTSQAGSFAATDSNSSVVANGSIQDINATNYATLTWSFDWTPPSTASGNVNFYVTGLATGSPGGSTSGNGVYQSVATLTGAAVADFSLSTSPSSLTITQGAGGTSTLSIAALNGFTGSVGLAASGLPSGVTASFSPSSATSSSTLTLTASSTATTGTASVTITGTSGSLSHTATVALTVNAAPNFSLSAAPGSVTITQGSSGTSTVSVAALNGFTGSVGLAASGLPSGVTASFNPASTTTSSTLTLSASSSAATGTATVTITGTSGSLSHTATLSLTVTPPADFSLTASPASLTLAEGFSGSSTVTIGKLNGFTGSVSLAASGLPSGVTASFNPASATSTSTLTLTASSSAATGTATVTITGTSGALSHTATLALTVSATASPDFSLSASPTSVAVTQGASGTNTVSVVPQNGFTSSVNLSASGLPGGVTASFSPASATTSSTLTLTASSGATTGAATVTITGTSGSLSHTTTLALTVNLAADFSLSISPASLAITQGTNGNSTVSVAVLNGFSGSVNLAASGLPSGVTATFTPASATSTSALTLTASNTAASGAATVTVTGTSGSLSHTATLALTVNQTIPTLTVTPAALTFNYQIGSPIPGPRTISIAAGSSATVFTAATGGSAWLAATPANATTPGVVSVSVAPGALAAGTYNDAIRIAAASAAGSPQTVAVTLVIISDTATRKVSTTPASALPDLVIDSQGNYDLAWADASAGVFFSRSTNQGATFPTSVAIPGSAGAAFQPQFVVDSTGNNVDVVWAQPAPASGSYNVLFSRSTDGGQHFASTPTTLTRAALPLSDAPRIALEPNAGVDVVWGRNETWVVRSSDGATFLSSAVLISNATQDSGGARVTVDSKGNIYVVWSDEVNKLASGSYCKLTTTSTTSAFTNTVGGNFYFNATASGAAFAASNTRNLANTDWAGVFAKWQPGFFGCSYDSVLLLMDLQDNLHIVWSTDSPDQNILASSYPAAASTGSHRASFPAVLNTTPASSPHAVVANNSNGTPTVHVTWSDGPSDLSAQAAAGIFYTHSTDTAAPFGKSFASPPTKVSTASSEFPQVGVDGGGNVNVAWQQSNASTANAFDVMLASSFDSGNTFAAPVTMSEQSSNECLGTNKTDTTQIPPPPYNTCGSVQLKVDSGNASNVAWVDLSTSSSDIIFARQVVTPPPGDFSMSIASASQTLTNGTATYTLTLAAANGFNQSVTVLCASGLPAGVGCSPVHVTPTASGVAAILNLMMTGTLPAGTYPFTIRGDAGLTTHSVQATLVVNNSAAPDFSISLSPASVSALPGQSVSLTATVSSIAGFNSAVSLACAGLPAGATCSVNPLPVVAPGSATVAVTFPASVGPGAYTFAITGAGASGNHSQVATMTTGAINASVSPGGSATIAVGSSANFAITLASSGGTSGPVTLACAGLPAGLTCTFNLALLNLPASGSVGTNLAVRVNAKPAAAPLHIHLQTEPPSTWLSWLITAMLMMLIAMRFAYRSSVPRRVALVRGFAMWLLTMALGMSLVSCAGFVGTSGTGTTGSTSSSSTTSVASSTQITLQAQSGNVTMNLATLSITVP
jgi:hypothetical protein